MIKITEKLTEVKYLEFKTMIFAITMLQSN